MSLCQICRDFESYGANQCAICYRRCCDNGECSVVDYRENALDFGFLCRICNPCSEEVIASWRKYNKNIYEKN
jgi:hypothetical protein